MFCENCGRLLNESDKFCQSCGKRVNRDENLFGEKLKVETETLNENENLQYSVATQENMESISEVPMPKPRKKWRKVVVIAAVLILLSSIIAYAAPVIKNMAQKLYYSPEDYFKVVVRREIKDTTDEIGTAISLIADSNSHFSDVTEEAEVTLQLGNGFYDIIESVGAGDISDKIDWIKKISLSGESSKVGTSISSEIDASINGNKILSLNVAMDESGIYLDIPEINSKAIKIDFDSIDYYDNPFYFYNAFLNSAEYQTLCEVIKLIPDEKTAQALLYKYVCKVIDSVDTVMEDSEKLTAGDIKQSCTKLSVSVNEELLRKMLISLLKEVKSDNEIKSVIRGFCEIDAVDVDFESVYSEMILGLDETISDLESTQGDREELVRFNIWVDKEGNLAGFGLEKDGASLSWISLESGKDYALKLNAQAGFLSSVSFEGNGRTSGDKKSGTFYIIAAGSKLAKIVSEYNVKDLKNGVFNGKISLELTDFIESLVHGEIADIVSDLKLTFESNTKSQKTEDVTLSLTKGSELCFSINENSKIKAPKKAIEIPRNYISVSEETEMLDWLPELDLDKLRKNLKSAGAPREITDAITQADEELKYYLQPQMDVFDEYDY